MAAIVALVKQRPQYAGVILCMDALMPRRQESRAAAAWMHLCREDIVESGYGNIGAECQESNSLASSLNGSVIGIRRCQQRHCFDVTEIGCQRQSPVKISVGGDVIALLLQQ